MPHLQVYCLVLLLLLLLLLSVMSLKMHQAAVSALHQQRMLPRPRLLLPGGCRPSMMGPQLRWHQAWQQQQQQQRLTSRRPQWQQPDQLSARRFRPAS